MSDFEDIRPYNDEEVRPTLDRLLADGEFLDAVAMLKVPKAIAFAKKLFRPAVRKRLSAELADVNSVADFQGLIETYMRQNLDTTIESLSFSGLEALDKNTPSLFISNHRDIAMDPALVNWGLYQNGFTTLRIAIGDNLLTKPFASDLMRLNKSFIVKRNLSSRKEKFRAAVNLSRYIHHSVLADRENVWIAQREGRAKDGMDFTNPALINMLTMSKDKSVSLADFVREASIVPVSISYALDPCDIDKAQELYQKQVHGSYTKEEHEDVQSIARGIVGNKHAVHVAFGSPLASEFDDVFQVAEELDRQIEANYVLHPTNCFAYEMLEQRTPKVLVGVSQTPYEEGDWNKLQSEFKERIATCNAGQKQILLEAYANPVYRRLGEK